MFMRSLKILDQSSRRIIKGYSFTSIQSLSSATSSVIENPEAYSAAKLNTTTWFPPENSRTIVTLQVVRSTLLNCPSDLIALSFFLWCARQPNYFHDRDAFGHMVDVLSRLTQRFLTVKEIIEQLKSVGCTTKPQTFLLLLRIYWFGGKYDMVFESFEEMIRCGYTPNTFARNIAMDVLFKIERVDVALRVLKETQLPNFLSFSIAVCNLCKLNDLINMHGVLREMLRKGFYLNPETFFMVLNCYCKSGQLNESLQVLGLMITLGIPTSVNVWSILIDGFCRSGRLDEAGNLLEKMVSCGCSLNVVACTSLIKGFMDSNMLNRAFHIINIMEGKGCYPDLVLCNVLIDCFSKMGRYDDALDVFHSFPRRKLVPDSYTFCSLISTICLSQQFVLLPILINELAIQPDFVVCNSLLSYFCKAGHPSAAVEFYNDMIDRGFIPDRYTYTGLLSGLCRMGRISKAVEVYRGIVRNHYDVDANIHTVIIDGLIKSGYFDRAIKMFLKAAREKSPLDVVSYTVAINGLFRDGRAVEAYDLFSQMKLIGLTPNVCTYNTILSGFCREKDVKMVKQILQEIIGTGSELNYRTFKLIKNLLYRTHFPQSVFDLLIELWDLELIPKNAMFAVLIDGLAHGVTISNTQLNLLKDNIIQAQDTSTSSSDDLSDVATSVG